MTATITEGTELRHPLKPRFEQHGIGTIPERDRRSTPLTFFLTFCGTGPNLGTIVFGWLPISFGLSFGAAMTSMSAGVLVALIPMAPLLILGTKTATNQATSSGAHFGVRGRLIGSGLGLVLVLLGMAIAVWSAGQILVDGAGRLLHTSTGNGALAFSYALLTVLSAVIAVWGYHLVVRANAALAIFGAVAVALLPAAFAGHLNPGYRGGHYFLGTFASTWVLSALSVGVGGVMTMSTLVGDWSRYVSARRYPPSRFLPLALLAVVLAYIVPMGIGALVATAFSHPAASLPQNLVTGAPVWYAAAVLVPLALLGNLGWCGASIYSTGLDLESIVPRAGRATPGGDERRRAVLTIVMSVLAVALVLAGSLAWNAGNAISTASSVLLVASAPWAAVIGVGYLRSRGCYSQADLQVFNRRQVGGDYWYWRGWNPPAVIAWAAGCVFGLLTVQATLYTGPFSGIASGPDVSFIGSFAIAAVVYLVLEVVVQRRGGFTAQPIRARTGRHTTAVPGTVGAARGDWRAEA